LNIRLIDKTWINWIVVLVHDLHLILLLTDAGSAAMLHDHRKACLVGSSVAVYVIYPSHSPAYCALPHPK